MGLVASVRLFVCLLVLPCLNTFRIYHTSCNSVLAKTYACEMCISQGGLTVAKIYGLVSQYQSHIRDRYFGQLTANIKLHMFYESGDYGQKKSTKVQKWTQIASLYGARMGPVQDLTGLAQSAHSQPRLGFERDFNGRETQHEARLEKMLG